MTEFPSQAWLTSETAWEGTCSRYVARRNYDRILTKYKQPDPQAAIADLERVSIPKYFPAFDKVLKDKTFVTGDKPCWADYVLFETVQWLVELLPSCLASYPHLKVLCNPLRN